MQIIWNLKSKLNCIEGWKFLNSFSTIKQLHNEIHLNQNEITHTPVIRRGNKLDVTFLNKYWKKFIIKQNLWCCMDYWISYCISYVSYSKKLQIIENKQWIANIPNISKNKWQFPYVMPSFHVQNLTSWKNSDGVDAESICTWKLGEYVIAASKHKNSLSRKNFHWECYMSHKGLKFFESLRFVSWIQSWWIRFGVGAKDSRDSK